MKISVEKQNVKEWLDALSEASKQEHYKNLWKRIYHLSAVPSRRRVSINFYKLEKSTKDGDNIIVPGKVLSEGALTHKLNIAALEYSRPALRVLKERNCRVMGLKDMLKMDKIKVIV